MKIFLVYLALCLIISTVAFVVFMVGMEVEIFESSLFAIITGSLISGTQYLFARYSSIC